MSQNFWGYHLSLDCAGCDHDSITSEQNVYNFIKELVPAIDMVAYGEPQIVDFGTGNKAGFTLSQLIMTSNICAHFTNEDNCMYLDVFSCKPFEIETVETCVKNYFKPTSLKPFFRNRQA